MSKLNIKPLGDRVLVEPMDPNETKKTAGGILIPDTVSKERSERGRVVAVGAGKRGEDGKVVPVAVKKGDEILFSKYGPDEIKVDGKEYFIISESNILAVIE
jgi:chaperonin GroES